MGDADVGVAHLDAFAHVGAAVELAHGVGDGVHPLLLLLHLHGGADARQQDQGQAKEDLHGWMNCCNAAVGMMSAVGSGYGFIPASDRCVCLVPI